MNSNEITVGEAVLEPAGAEDECDFVTKDDFQYDGYQVVRGEFFAHLYEPSISFSQNRLIANTACVNKLPDVEYVQVLVNPKDKKLAIRPCTEDEKDSFKWSNPNKANGKKKPKYITCKMFYAKIMTLMGWNPDYRYKLLGKLVKSNGEYLFIFDLTAAEVYYRIRTDDKKMKASRTPVFPAEWKDQFGLPVEEHKKQLQINIFNGYTVFGIKDETDGRDTEHDSQSVNND